MKRERWSKQDDIFLAEVYALRGRQAALKAFPHRSATAIDCRLTLLKDKRPARVRTKPKEKIEIMYFPMPWLCPIRCHDALAAQRAAE